MLRRDFFKLCLATASAASIPTACTKLPNRYRKPDVAFTGKDRLLLQNLHLVDVRNKRLFAENALLVQNGVIQARLHLDGTSSLPDAHRVDLGGAYLAPGMINSHCHMTLPGGLGIAPSLAFAYRRQVERNAEECVKHGVTTVRDMLAVSDWLFRLKRKIEEGKVVGPRILRSCALEVKNGYGDQLSLLADPRFYKEIKSPKQARMAVRQCVEEGVDFLKIFQQTDKNTLPAHHLAKMDLETMQVIAKEALRHRLPVAIHQTEAAGLHLALNAGIPHLEHVPRDRALTEQEILDVQSSGAKITPTINVTFGLSQPRLGDPNWNQGMIPWLESKREALLPPLLNRFLEPEFAKASLDFYRKLQDPQSYETKHVIPWPDQSKFTAAAVIGVENTQALYQAGVEFLAGNDGGVPFVFPGAMGLELYMLEHIGFRPADLLQMATFNNAKAIGMERSLGQVEAGYIADLVLHRQNPLQSTRHLLEPLAVLQAGELAYATEGFRQPWQG